MRATIGKQASIKRIAALGSAVIVLALAACAGDNLFENGGTQSVGAPPTIASVTVASTAREGQKVDVRVKALGRRGIKQVDIRYRGAINQDQSFPIDPVQSDTVTIDASVQLPDTVSDNTLRIEVTATDQFGGVSEIASRTVSITDASAPAITATVASTTASQGGTIALTVSARDALGLTQIGYAVVTSTGDTIGGTPTLVSSSGIARDTVFRIGLPATIQPSEVKVLGIAVNASNMRGVSLPLAVTVVDSLKPTVDIVEPNTGDSYPLRDSIAVRVHVADASGIQSVSIRGVAFRNFPDSTQNSVPVVRFPTVTVPLPQGPDRPIPTDTTIFRYIKPNADTTSEPIYIIAQATDAQNNIGVDTVRIIPGPRIVILTPTNGAVARINSDLLVRLQANDPQSGIDSLKLYIAGVQQDSFVFKGLGSTRDQIDRSVTLHIGGQTGQLTLRALVYNSLGVRGSTSNSPVITITNNASNDTIPPQVQRVLLSRDRIELGDSVNVRVTATDGTGTGITRMGAVVITIPEHESPLLPRDTFYLMSRTYSPALGGTPDTTFTFFLRDAYKEVGAARFPLPFTIQVQAFAIDGAGKCGAAVQETFQSLPCSAVPAQAGFFVAEGQTGRVYNPTAVVGTSVRLPTGSIIADAIPDTRTNRVYLSNQLITRAGVEVLNLGDTTLTPNTIKVGSAPWGMFLVKSKTGASDTLMVANSGGTNISFVPTDGPSSSLAEVPSRRLLTPNEVLYEVDEALANGFRRYTTKFYDFSDRPQFLAEDSNKVILYSTQPTSAATPGTIRRAIADPTPLDPTDPVVPESKILFTGDAVTPNTTTIAIAYVDSIKIGRDSIGDDVAVIYDHIPGFPNVPAKRIVSAALPIQLAVLDARAKGSDIFFDFGIWNLSGVGLRDTTYVANSGDLSTVGFGEGATAPTGRIILWQASPVPALPEAGILSSYLVSRDLISNASDRVMGLALNSNGKFGVGRGLESTYFFSNDVQSEGLLRLQGRFSIGVQGGNGGVALHPGHTYDVAQGSNDSTLAFIATSNRTIKVVDTYHFFERGEIPIRDNIVGQLRAATPPASANIGLPATSCDYTVTQLYGVTASNSVVIVNVRRRDIIKNTSGTCN